MVQTIQIKRSALTTIPASLADGELAYSIFGTVDALYIGAGGGIHTIGGKSFTVKLDTISTGAEVNPDLVSQAEAEAGTATDERIWSALRVAQAIAALGSSSAPVDSVFGRTGVVIAVAGDYTAAEVTNVAAGNIAAVTVQGALNELDTEKLALAGGTMTGALVLSGAPTLDLHSATKGYVDALITGLDPKESVNAATTGAITLSGTQTIDGVVLIVGDRVLVQDQGGVASHVDNGIYVVAAGAWARSPDADNSPAGEVTSGMYTIAINGTVNGSKGFILTTPDPITLGVTALTFVLFSDASSTAVDSVFGRTGVVVAVSGDYTAAQITNTPAGAVAAVTVQAAINELDTEKLALAGGTMTGALILSGAPTINLHAATKLYVDTHTIDGGTF